MKGLKKRKIYTATDCPTNQEKLKILWAKERVLEGDEELIRFLRDPPEGGHH